jgi:hypothetical protein
VLNRDLIKWDNLRLLDILVREVKNEKDRDIDIRRNESLVAPAAMNMNQYLDILC